MATRGWENATPSDVRDRRQVVSPAKAVARLTTLAPAVSIRKRRAGGPNDWADVLYAQLQALRLPLPEREYRFDPVRKWRMDLAFVERRIFVECDGGEFIHGSKRHGGRADCEKANAAVAAGWHPYRFTGSMIRSGAAIEVLEQVLKP